MGYVVYDVALDVDGEKSTHAIGPIRQELNQEANDNAKVFFMVSFNLPLNDETFATSRNL